MKLRIGDKVRFLNETGEGVITRFKSKDMVFVEMHDGFEIPYLIKFLVPVHTELILNPEVENMDVIAESILSDCVYFIIEPDHELPLLVSDYKCYLFNSSSYNMSFTYSVKDDRYYQTLKHGELGAYQKVLLKQFKKDFLQEYQFHKIECLFFKNTHYKNQFPIAEILSINDRSLKENVLAKHNEFKHPVFAFVLKDDFTNAEIIEQQLNSEDITRLKAIKEFKQVRKLSASARQKLKSLEKEVDLHIEELIDSHSGLTNAQILNIQVEHFEQELDTAMAGGLKKVVFIHGVGNGRLKQELISILKTLDGISYHDASYKKYGFGATEVVIH